MHAIAWTRSIRASDLQDNIKSGLLSGRAKETLRHTEVVLVLRTLFLRNREVRPLWWDVAAEASSRFPSNQALALFAAEAIVDRNVLVTEKRGRLAVGKSERISVEKAADVLETNWERIKSSEVPELEGGAILNALMIARRLLGDRSLSP